MRILNRDGAEAVVLLIEDNQADIRLTKEAFRALPVPSTVHAVSNGEDAVDFIFRRGEFADAPVPDLIFLDLNIPKLDGFTVMKMVKEDSEKRRIPLIVLSTSQNDDDLKRAYDYHANAYLVKPISFHIFEKLIKHICDFWMMEAAYPEKTE